LVQLEEGGSEESFIPSEGGVLLADPLQKPAASVGNIRMWALTIDVVIGVHGDQT